MALTHRRLLYRLLLQLRPVRILIQLTLPITRILTILSLRILVLRMLKISNQTLDHTKQEPQVTEPKSRTDPAEGCKDCLPGSQNPSSSLQTNFEAKEGSGCCHTHLYYAGILPLYGSKEIGRSSSQSSPQEDFYQNKEEEFSCS